MAVVAGCWQSSTKVTITQDKMADISDFARLLKMMTRDINGNKVQLRDKVRWIQISEFGNYRFKHSFSDDEEWKDVLLTSRSNEMLPDITYLPRRMLESVWYVGHLVTHACYGDFRFVEGTCHYCLIFVNWICVLSVCEQDRDPTVLLGWTPDPSPWLKVTGNARANRTT